MNPTHDAALRDAILTERAARLAAPIERESRENGRSMLIVQLGVESVAIPVESIRDVAPMPPVARLPGMPPWQLGVAQHRGDPLSVLELCRLLGRSSCVEPSMLVIVEIPPRAIAIAADALVGIRDIFADEYASDLSSSASEEASMIDAVTSDLISIIHPERLFADPRLMIEKSATQPVGPDWLARRRSTMPPSPFHLNRQEEIE